MNEKGVRIMRVGDLCLKESAKGIDIRFIINEVNMWNETLKLGCISKPELLPGGNIMVYSYDEAHPRLGNINLLKDIISIAGCLPIKRFFENVLDILQFKEDFLDLSAFKDLVEPYIKKRGKMTKLIENTDGNKRFPLFMYFLPASLQNQMNLCIESGESLRSIYTSMRLQYPREFRSAFNAFMRANPSASIYDISD